MSDDQLRGLTQGFFIIGVLCLALSGTILLVALLYPGAQSETKPCDCTINYNGNNVSVEDALELAGEGLTTDQADEVKILIDEYCK